MVRGDGHEGFVPAGFIYPLDAIQKQRENLDIYRYVDTQMFRYSTVVLQSTSA